MPSRCVAADALESITFTGRQGNQLQMLPVGYFAREAIAQISNRLERVTNYVPQLLLRLT